jgi:uncharacterized membrane protein YeaQ/YmgE (transglycosylase-associated protein family)
MHDMRSMALCGDTGTKIVSVSRIAFYLGPVIWRRKGPQEGPSCWLYSRMECAGAGSLAIIALKRAPTSRCWPLFAGLAAVRAYIIENYAVPAQSECPTNWEGAMSIIWTIIIGFVAGVVARFFHPGNKYEPKGFILTTVLGIVGAFVATYLGQAVGWYKAGEGAGFIGAIVGAIIVLVVWGLIAPRLERT